MTSAEVRQAFIDFFAERKHTIVPSSPVIPQDDPTLLFINAGMNQFKDVFLGTGTRDYSRAVDSQKCIRVSGKHNDLEEVGPSPNHHTFFEMLGNWSFGDYYKAEAIRWAWELMTEVYGLPKDKLYATVFTDDDEAHKLWESETDIDPSHISRHGYKDNFWEMGEVGPCGPCTEIHIDLGKPAPGKQAIKNDGPNTESGRYVELWNLVFIQSFRDKSGKLSDLPATHVDTGAGLERIARVMQGVESNYETDLFAPIISEIAERSGVAYELNGIHIPHRVIADHVRSLSFAIADGGKIGKDGRDYVLRRILRRATYYAKEKLGFEGPFIYSLVHVLADVMGTHYTEIKERQLHIETVIKAEEESFLKTLDNGIHHFNLSSKNTASNELWKNKEYNQLTKRCIEFNKRISLSCLDYDQARPEWHIEFEKTLDSFAGGSFDPFSMNWDGLIKLIFDDIEIPKMFDLFAKSIDANELTSKKIAIEISEVILKCARKFKQIAIIYRKNAGISGKDAFILHDRFGFPIDLTQKIAFERGISVDMEGFNSKMEATKKRSRAGAKFVQGDSGFYEVSNGEHSQFTGYDSLEELTEVRMTRKIEEGPGTNRYAFVLAKTPFYAESGGQVADFGTISGEGWEYKVYDVRMEGDRRVHFATREKQPSADRLPKRGPGPFPVPSQVTAKLDLDRRHRILPHHTTTHLLQAALQEVLGKHVSQAGSAVGPDKMTFDFTHFEKPSAEQLAEAEAIVNRVIREDLQVSASHMDIKQAKAQGAMALFGEKYDDQVRVITIGDDGDSKKFSMELCGGTHLERTGQAGLFRIESETGLSAGVRRVECTAGEAAYEKMVEKRETLLDIEESIGSGGSDPAEKITKLLLRQKEMQKEIERLQHAALKGSVDMLADWGVELEFQGTTITGVFAHTDAISDKNGLQQVGDKIIERLQQADKEGFGLVGATMDKTYMFVAVITPGLIKQGLMAGKLVGAVAKLAGGGGGGKPDFATAGSKDTVAAKGLISDRDRFERVLADILPTL